MGLFIDSIVKPLVGSLGQQATVSGITTAPLASVGNVLRNWMKHIDETDNQVGEFILALTLDDSLMPESMKDGLTTSFDSLSCYRQFEDAAVATHISSYIDWVISNHNGRLGFSDANGYGYGLLFQKINDQYLVTWNTEYPGAPFFIQIVGDVVTFCPYAVPYNIIITQIHPSGGSPYFEYSMPSVDIAFPTLADIIRDLGISDTINSILYEASDMILSAKFTVSDFFQKIHNKFGEIKGGSKQVCDGIASSFQKGGIYGVACYIVNVLKTTASIHAQDGVLEFTNNTAPEEYVAGMVMGIIGTVSSLASAVIAFIQPVLAGVFAGVGAILTALPQALNYDYDSNTLARVTFDETQIMALNYAPMAAFQAEIPFDNTQGIVLIKQTLTERGPFYIDVPGGMLLFGYSSDSTKFRVEFHAALATYDLTPFGFVEYQDEYSYRSPLDCIRFAAFDGFQMSSEIFQEVMDSAQPLSLEFDEAYICTVASDSLLQQNLINNVSLFSLFMYFLVNGNPDIGDEIMIPYAHKHQDTQYIAPTYKYIFGLVENGDFFDFLAGLVFKDWEGQTFFWNESDLTNWSYMTKKFFASGKVLNSQTAYNTVAGAYITAEEWDSLVSIDPLDRLASITGSSFTIRVGSHAFNELMRTKSFYGTATSVNNGTVWAYVIPKYNRSTFWMWALLGVAVTAIAIVATAIITTTVRKKLRTYHLKQAVKMEALNDELKRNPSPANLKAYDKAAFKNNAFATVLGGTKYSREGFWNSTGSSATSSTFDSLSSLMGSSTCSDLSSALYVAITGRDIND